MDSSSGMVGRNMAGINQPRPRDFNGGDSALGWGGSIWNTTATSTLGSAFGSTPRDSSRPRENGTYMGTSADAIEGKTGSGSLVASSESDNWNPHRNRWGESATAGIPHARSSGVSPARKRSVAQVEPSQQYGDNAPPTYFPVSRPSVVGQAPVAKPSKPLLDPTSMNFTSARRIDPLTTTGFANFGFGQVDTQQRSEASVGSWPDAASVHSPNDDRRSAANSEYFGPSSATPSRSGSLPPSRHGNEPLQFNQNADSFSRYAQSGQRQHSSFSAANGRGFQERSGSIQSDTMHMLARLSLDQDPDPGIMSHRASMSINGLPSFSPATNEASLAREGFADTQTLTRRDDGAYGNAGAYTPDVYPNGHVGDPSAQFRSFHFDSRSAPNGTGTRQSPFLSHTHTPPVFDHLYPSRTAEQQTLSNGNSIAFVQSKLQGLQLQQERRNYANPNQYHHHQQQQQQQLHQILAANQLRNAYPYQFSVPNVMHLNGLPPNLTLAPIPAIIPIEPPKAPRDHGNAPEHGTTMSVVLLNFKQANKTNRRIELKDIYGHVVEFSGDQHGSRFIQQKLESANSDEKDKIFRELQENSLQLMQDVFGNYVIQKFFEHGDQTQKKILANRMKGHVATLAMGMYGCRVVQKALEHVLTDQQAWIVKELEKDTLKCVRDANGNHVIQKVIERVPIEYIYNVIEAFRGQVGALALNGFGCRVIQRLLEKVPEPHRRFILMELHAEGSKLISDPYGNYVTQHVIEHGLPEDRAKIITLVRAQLLTFSKHKFASNVVEKCLLYGTSEQRRDIMLTVTERNERGENSLPTLIKDGFGNYVIQKLMDTLSRRDYDELVAVLKPELEKAKKIISGKQITSVEKKLHRFDRIDSASDTAATPPNPLNSDATASRPNPLSSPTDSPPLPPLTSDAQSPQSSSLPSANTSTVDEPVHTSPSTDKDLTTSPSVVSIEHAS